VEVSGRGRSANLSKICLGSPQIFQPNKDKGCDTVATVQRGRVLMAGYSLGSLGRFTREGEEKNKKSTRFCEFGQNSIEFEMCKVLVQGW
jgi:hypothetical protein